MWSLQAFRPPSCRRFAAVAPGLRTECGPAVPRPAERGPQSPHTAQGRGGRSGMGRVRRLSGRREPRIEDITWCEVLSPVSRCWLFGRVGVRDVCTHRLL
jgi:hypothetical protein